MLLPNWRGDVSVLIDDSAKMIEWVKYSAYGIPCGIPLADTDSNGLLNVLDYIAILTYGGGYDVRYDPNLDGVIDSTDATLANAASPITLGWGNLSDVGNRKGYAGYELDPALAYNLWHIRNRVFNSDLGMWMTRDPSGYVDEKALNLYVYGPEQPLIGTDPQGTDFGNRFPGSPRRKVKICVKWNDTCLIAHTGRCANELEDCVDNILGGNGAGCIACMKDCRGKKTPQGKAF